VTRRSSWSGRPGRVLARTRARGPYYRAMRLRFLAGLWLALSVAGCGGADEDKASAPSEPAASAPATPSPTPTVASPSPSASGSYVAQVNALCEAMIPKVMAVRGDDDGDGGGDFPAITEFEGQEDKLKPIIAEFDAAVEAIPVTDADRPAADALKAYGEMSDAEAAKMLAAAQSGDQQKYDDASRPSAEFEAKRQALEAVGISCPAR
jgi:hypothetical protein